MDPGAIVRTIWDFICKKKHNVWQINTFHSPFFSTHPVGKKWRKKIQLYGYLKFYLISHQREKWASLGLWTIQWLKFLATDESPNISIPRFRIMRKEVVIAMSMALFNTLWIFQLNLSSDFFAVGLPFFCLANNPGLIFRKGGDRKRKTLNINQFPCL